jgi:O-antigen ligase
VVVRFFFKMMLGKSIPEYIFIRTAIAALRLIAPLSVLCVAWMLQVPAPAQLDPKWAFLYSCSLIYASLEAAFFVCIYLPRRYRLQKVCTIVLVVVVGAFC